MVAAEIPEPSLRGMRAESSRLAWAFGISIAVHLLLFGGYQTGKRLHLWQNWEWPDWMRPPQMLTELFKKKPTPQQIALMEKKEEEERVPLLFVDVSPSQATLEPPKKTDYYSDQNSQAANPDPSRDTNIPRIDGKQTDIVKTEDITKRTAVPLQPALPPEPAPQPAEPAKPEPKPADLKPEIKAQPASVETKTEVKPLPQPAKPDEKPRPSLTPGDLTLGHPAETNRTGEGQAESRHEEATPAPATASPPAKPSKPRTLAEARARQPDQSGLVGEKMRQEGGVRRNKLQSSLDVLATPFGAYDAAIVSAIQNRWYALLEDRWYADDRKGRVMLRFHLNSDGSISQMTLVQNTVDLTLALLCESAIRDPAPYKAWPEEMRRVIGADYREVTFTFYYR